MKLSPPTPAPVCRRFLPLVILGFGVVLFQPIASAQDVNPPDAAEEFNNDLTAREAVTKAIKEDHADPVAVISNLKTHEKVMGKPTANNRLRHGLAVMDIAMRLYYQGDKGSAEKLFREAVRILEGSIKEFSDSEKTDRATAYCQLAFIEAGFLRLYPDAMDAYDAALVDDPKNESVQLARDRLNAQWGPAIEAARSVKSSGKST